MRFLIESLADSDTQFKELGGPGLLIFRGKPTVIFRRLHEELRINKICYEQDCEPIWEERDKAVEKLCRELDIETVEKISHTLWDPKDIINVNGGSAPLTYQMMLHTVKVLGLPQRPTPDAVDFTSVNFGLIPEHLAAELGLFTTVNSFDKFIFNLMIPFCFKIPKPEDFSIFEEACGTESYHHLKGGETNALNQLKRRLVVEQEAFASGTYLPNQANVDLLSPTTSMSAALRFGCLSVRKFYYAIHDKFSEVQEKFSYQVPGGHHITGQLIWREYFYTMSVLNPNYGQMKGNPICLKIPWGVPREGDILKWKQGKTGVPIIDAAMRQLMVRN